MNHICLLCPLPVAKHKGARFCSRTCSNRFNGQKKLQPWQKRFEKKLGKLGQIPNHCSHLGRCWPWTDTLNAAGYGVLGKGGKSGGMMLAHRASWIIHRGLIPDKKQVLHHCDNPKCVNPKHLYLGGDSENVRDKVIRNRQLKGTQIVQSKLTNDQVHSIRNMLDLGEQQKLIAAKFNVDPSSISHIATGKNWQWL